MESFLLSSDENMSFKSISLLVCLSASNALFAFDHAHKDFTSFLKSHTKINKLKIHVDYKKIKKHPEHLNLYLEQLIDVKKSEFELFTKNEKLVFWINAYNAFSIQKVIMHYPVKSFEDIGTMFSSVWSHKFINLLEEKLSLDDIYHKKIRKIFKDPRVHFALSSNCVSCPNLSQKSYVAKKLDKQLNEASMRFLNDESKNFYSRKEKVHYLSKIFMWYGADFNATYKGYTNFIKKYKKTNKDIAVEWLPFNWDINDLN